MNWKEIALQMESDPKVRKVLLEGPRSLAQAWMLQAMKFKYGRLKSEHRGAATPLFCVYNKQVNNKGTWHSPKKASSIVSVNRMASR